jgi:hypothetical protein
MHRNIFCDTILYARKIPEIKNLDKLSIPVDEKKILANEKNKMSNFYKERPNYSGQK